MSSRVLINIDVDDLERGIAFYRDGLGLHLRRYLFDATVAEMTCASTTIYLLARPADSLPSKRIGIGRDYRRHWTPVHLDFTVDDLDTAVAQALAAGGTLENDVAKDDWGRIAMLSDPWAMGSAC